VAAAAARAAPGIVTLVLTSANASWETRSGNSVSKATTNLRTDFSVSESRPFLFTNHSILLASR